MFSCVSGWPDVVSADAGGRGENGVFLLERKVTELNALEQIVGRGASGDRSDPLEFMDEYATVMNRYTQIEVRNGFKEGYADLSLNFGFGDGGCCGWRMVFIVLTRRSVGRFRRGECLILLRLS